MMGEDIAGGDAGMAPSNITVKPVERHERFTKNRKRKKVCYKKSHANVPGELRDKLL